MKPRQQQTRGGHDRWLLSYADLVTLLLAVFTTLYAASTVDADKMKPIASSLREAFDAPPMLAAERSEKDSIVPPVAIVAYERKRDELRSRLTLELAEALRTERVEIHRDERGLVLSLPEDASFAVGSPAPSAEAQALIARVAAAIEFTPNTVRIEGHTDDVPIRTARYSSNWELSTARASAVVAYLVESTGLDPARLSAAGYGEFHPRVANDSPENRARNRRIDVVILDPPSPAEKARTAGLAEAETADSEIGTGGAGSGTQESGLGTGGSGAGARDSGLATRDSGPRTRDSGSGTRDSAVETQDAEFAAGDSWLGAPEPGLGARDSGLGTQNAVGRAPRSGPAAQRPAGVATPSTGAAR